MLKLFLRSLPFNTLIYASKLDVYDQNLAIERTFFNFNPGTWNFILIFIIGTYYLPYIPRITK